MVEISVIVSIVVAALSLAGTVTVAAVGYLREKRKDDLQLATLAAKYSQPLMIAAYELQARLYELVEYPISKEHLETEEGLDDIKIFTCYRFAQFLAWTYILESKTQYFSFTKDKKLRKIADLILRLNEEFDRRRNKDGANIGVWPGSRLLISARMIEKDVDKDTPLDMIVKSYDTFLDEWPNTFKSPMGYFCQWIDDMVDGRQNQYDHRDDALRCTQHNLVTMIELLDTKKSLIKMSKRAEPRPHFCDCGKCPWNADKLPLEYRKHSRHNDVGIVPWYKSEGKIDNAYKASINMEGLRSFTYLDRYNQTLYREYRKGHPIESLLPV